MLIDWSVASLLSWFLTGQFRAWAIAQQRMDMPNHRSSHTVPTPRGGGVVFVLVFMLSLMIIDYQSMLPPALFNALLVMGFGTACLGWCDDFLSLSPWLRLSGQFILALWVMQSSDFQMLTFWDFPTWLSMMLGTIYLVWMINMFNFMDGMNGYAVMESIFLMMAMLFLCGVSMGAGLSGLVGCLCASLFGFVVWNFPHAKIFMGDVGSGFLGGVMGVLSLYWIHVEPSALGLWTILIALFMSDSGWTLLRRILRGEKFWQAHREHAYQHLIRRWNSHARVTGLGFLINVSWLLSLAWLLHQELLNNLEAISLAYLSLLLGCWLSHGGRPDVSYGIK